MKLMNKKLITRRTVSRCKARHPGYEWGVEGRFVRATRRFIVLEEIEWNDIPGVETPVPQRTGRIVFIPFRLRPDMRNALFTQDVWPGDLIDVSPDIEDRRFVIANFSWRQNPGITSEVEITGPDGKLL
jgi:hypothetical protein